MSLQVYTQKLFKFYASANFFKLGFEFFSFFFGKAFFDNFRCAVNDCFSFFEPETSCFTNNFDDFDLGRSSVCEFNVEFRLLFSSCFSAACACCCYWSCSCYAEFFFNCFNKVVEFKYGHFFYCFNDLFLRHYNSSVFLIDWFRLLRFVSLHRLL